MRGAARILLSWRDSKAKSGRRIATAPPADRGDGAAEASVSRRRSSHVTRPKLLVHVTAKNSLRSRIVAALEADGVSIINDTSSATIRVAAVDLSHAISVRELRQRLRLGTAARLADRSAQRLVAVSPRCGPLGARRAVRAGADSLVLEHELEQALAPAVRAVAAGFSVVPAVLRQSSHRVAFSHREREVLRLAVGGRTNNEIAAALFLAESTVKTHLSSAYRKLGAESRKDAAAMILDPEEGLAELVLGAPSSSSAQVATTAKAEPASPSPADRHRTERNSDKTCLLHPDPVM
jgi:DNA-binding NarL/FixJ family response regulator